jgi:parallel beta-helix repeat protein
MRRKILAPVTVAAMAGGLLLGAPTIADAAAYSCKGAEKGVYKLCIYDKTDVKISGKTFSNAQNGIYIKNSSNITISGNTFKHLSGPKGYGGVHVKSSTGVVIKGNTFSGLGNSGNMHGVYMVQTSSSYVTGNKFSYVYGDPVRIRDASKNNTVSGNTFVRSGQNAVFSEWAKLPPYGSEKCGGGNVLKNNKYGTSYRNESIAKIKWGGKGGSTVNGKKTRLTWNNCSKASIKDGGGNTKI